MVPCGRCGPEMGAIRKRAGRPPMDPDERLDAYVKVRLRKADYRRLIRLARSKDTSPATLARAAILRLIGPP